MDDKTLDNKITIATAFASIDFTKFKNTGDAERAVLTRIDLARRMLDDDGIAMAMLDSTRVYATIKDIAFEESSQRYVVSFVGDNSKNAKVETIRTDRVDGQNGFLVKTLWGDTTKLIGQHVCMYKKNDIPTADQSAELRKKDIKVPPQGYRRAVYVKVVPRYDKKQQ